MLALDSQRATSVQARVLIVTSAICRYFSAVKTTWALVILPRILAMRSIPSSANVRNGWVIATCLPVHSTGMLRLLEGFRGPQDARFYSIFGIAVWLRDSPAAALIVKTPHTSQCTRVHRSKNA